MQDKKSLKNLKIKKLTIVGVIPSFAFQRAKHCALELHRKLPQRFPLPEIVGLLELDWSEKLQEWRQTLGKDYWCLRRPVAVFFDDKFIGSDIELIKLITLGNILIENIPRKNMSVLKKHFRTEYLAYLRKTKRIYCYLDICINEVYAGTLTFQLYSDLLPRTCENFKTLCLGSRGPLLSYRGSRIHRIVKKGWLQGGDVQYKTGGGGFSIFCDPLEDECFGISHDRRGVLSMANGGRHANGSQFFITLQPSKWMDTHFVAFGQLIEGAKVLKTLENLETFYECPLSKVEIKSCGKLDLEDVEDVDAMYREEPLPPKKPKKIETICEQVVRLIMEALTEALARKERTPDILDCGDIPSKMNIQLYFQGFYSLPESILEESAKYLRGLRRKLLRVIKPSATEIVEVIMYELQMAVLTRMTTLDDVRETIGHELYEKMISGIDMNLEMCKKSYVRRMIDQIASTAENMVNQVTKKIQLMKARSVNLKKFQDSMQNWVQSFVLQETFAGDNYFIADRPVKPEKPKEEKELPKREGKPCCEKERKKKEEELKAKLMAKYGPEDLCCLGSKLHLSESEINLYDFFSTCRYDLKRVPRAEEERMPLLDLIEISRYKLRWIRKQENRVRDQGRLCTEKKIRKWMAEVGYTPETSWLKDSVFPKDCLVLDHIEEILYGAMTAGLLEMYYFMEQYLKLCGMKKKLVTTIIYPEDSDIGLHVRNADINKESEKEQPEEERGEQEKKEEVKEEEEEEEETKQEEERRPCTCGHPCCRCPFEPILKPLETVEEEGEGEAMLSEEGEEKVEEEEETSEKEPPAEEPKQPCASDETLVDLNAVLAEKLSVKPEEIDIRSFKWLKPYILEKGCDLKTEFATQVHKWLEGESFTYKGFISKHSLATRASLLSLSFSLAELIKEENNYKTDIKNFIYDLWNLYFEEIFKEAFIEFPPEQEEEEETEDQQPKELPEEGTKAEEADVGEDEKCDLDLTDLEKYCQNLDISEKELPGEVEENPQFLESTKPEEIQEHQETSEPQEEIKEPEVAQPVDDEEKTEEEEFGIKESVSYQPMEARSDEEKVAKGDVGKSEDVDAGSEEKPPKKKKSPIVVQEYVEESIGEESRDMPPYVLPFWVKFLTELTKQALGALAKVSRLPRRLYFQTDSEMAFDDKMKEWFDFNAFNPQATKGREVMDFIAVHHKSLTNLEDSARSYLRKKKYTELLNRCTRFSSADDVAEEIVADVIDTAKGESGHEMLELFVSDFLGSAIASTTAKSGSFVDEEDEDFRSFKTDSRESRDSIPENESDW